MPAVKGYIQRKSMLYETDVEYGDYTMNHVLGCSHGCKYPCYAYLMKKRFGSVTSYETWLEPYLVSNTIELLNEEIPKLKHKIHSVQLCFSSDPFMYGYQDIAVMSISSIKLLNAHGIKCTVLTKGILPDELSLLHHDNEYGITLITLDENFRKQMEPGAAPIADRLGALRRLHDLGCRTWVSIEPYPTPNIIQQDLETILQQVSFVDRIIFGRLNYNKKVTAYKKQEDFFNDCAAKVISFCNANGIKYHIKKGTIKTDSDS